MTPLTSRRLSISRSSWLRMRWYTSAWIDSALDLGAIASIVSKKSRQGAARRERRGALLDEELARGARLDFFQPRQEIVARHLQLLDVRGFVGRQKSAQRDHPDFLTERFEIGTDEPVRMLGDFGEIHVG